ncbi:hypothetical protein BJY04DRAFT_224825 [Aspergillus karnatakaensis]|uniref:uncharacterized protein n=1 Tax=Aspergillus karnatakaensis TaxID=1810916 RepID=UPI003CCD1B20
MDKSSSCMPYGLSWLALSDFSQERHKGGTLARIWGSLLLQLDLRPPAFLPSATPHSTTEAPTSSPRDPRQRKGQIQDVFLPNQPDFPISVASDERSKDVDSMQKAVGPALPSGRSQIAPGVPAGTGHTIANYGESGWESPNSITSQLQPLEARSTPSLLPTDSMPAFRSCLFVDLIKCGVKRQRIGKRPKQAT